MAFLKLQDRAENNSDVYETIFENEHTVEEINAE